MTFGTSNTSRQILQKCAALFSPDAQQSEKFKLYESYLREDEFELSLDMLEDLLFDTNPKKDEYWILNYFRTACENMGLMERERYFRAEITRLAFKDYKPVLIENPDLIGEVRYLSWFENGRLTPVISGYRPQFKYEKDTDWGAVQQLINKEICFPGETSVVHFKFIVAHNHADKCQIGQSFVIREGSTVVGTGKILEIPQK